MAGIDEYILVRRAAAYSIIHTIYQVQVLCCETTNGVYVTKRETTVKATRRAAAAAAAALCLHILQEDGLIDCSDDTSIIIDHCTIHTFTLEQKRKMSRTKENVHVLKSNLGRRDQRGSHVLRLFHGNLSDLYVPIRTNRRLGKIDRKR